MADLACGTYKTYALYLRKLCLSPLRAWKEDPKHALYVHCPILPISTSSSTVRRKAQYRYSCSSSTADAGTGSDRIKYIELLNEVSLDFSGRVVRLPPHTELSTVNTGLVLERWSCLSRQGCFTVLTLPSAQRRASYFCVTTP